MSVRTLYLESFSGIAGDMFAAAFLDAGLLDPDELRSVPEQLGVPRAAVEVTVLKRAGTRATHVEVRSGGEKAEAGAHHHHHHYPALVQRISDSSLSGRAKAFALDVYRLLAEAEADAHGVTVEEVAFHEVGTVDSVVDVAMAGVCVERVAADRFLASPVKLGRGTVDIAHGTYPVPPPASARLAVGMPVDPVPEAVARENVELSTPTGLAILKALGPEFVSGWPGGGTLLAHGAGAGTMDLAGYPNVFRVAVFEETGRAAPYETDRVVELRCNVDDQTGERTAWIMESALEKGALDAWVTPLVGKKGRPANALAFLVRPDAVSAMADFLLRHSSSFGVRYATWDRFKLSREEEVRETPHGPVSFSVGRNAAGDFVKEKPEFEHLRRIWETDPDFEA